MHIFKMTRILRRWQKLELFGTNLLFRRSQISQKFSKKLKKRFKNGFGMILVLFLCRKMCKTTRKIA